MRYIFRGSFGIYARKSVVSGFVPLWKIFEIVEYSDES